MQHAPRLAFVMALIVLAASACSAGASSPPASASSAPATAAPSVGFAESGAAFCSAFGSMLRAIGNPDAGTPSTLSKALDDAVKAGDVAAAEKAAASITTELESGRAKAAIAAGWPAAAATMAAMDRLLLAFEARVAAQRLVAAHAPGAIDPDKAFEQAGGGAAWTAMLQGATTMPTPSGVTPSPCPAFSGTP